MQSVVRLFLFPRFAVRPDPRAGEGLPGLERLWHDSPQGRVEAWFLPGRGVSADAPGPLVVFAHGNAELIEHWPEVLEPYREMGVSILLPEYRGYGRSAGAPSERAIGEDFLAFFDRVVARPDVDASRVVLHGRSLGGGAVCLVAARRSVSALILQSTFTSVADIVRRWWLPGALVADRFDNLATVRAFDRPILVVHGRNDRVVPHEHGRALAGAGSRARLVSYDADHNDCPPQWGSFWREVRSFLAEAAVL